MTQSQHLAVRAFANGCDSSPVPFLEGLWVDSAFRRQKIGQALVRAIEEWAVRRGFRELGSDAYLSARISHLAHRAYGFTETERVVYFKKKLRTANGARARRR
jgi:aminoglycoside 6'-N-acetyltransferase I